MSSEVGNLNNRFYQTLAYNTDWVLRWGQEPELLSYWEGGETKKSLLAEISANTVSKRRLFYMYKVNQFVMLCFYHKYTAGVFNIF